MARNKWDRAKIGILPLPFLFAAMYAARAPLPVPAFLLPQRTYLALDRGVEPGALAAARVRGETFAARGGGLEPIAAPTSPEAAARALSSFPDLPAIGPVLRDLEAGTGPLRRARLLLSRRPSAAELSALDAAAARRGAPLAVEVLVPPPAAPVAALSRRYAPAERRLPFELLLGPEARSFAAVEVTSGSALLYRASGRELPADLVLRLSAGKEDGGAVEASFVAGDGTRRARRLLLGSGLEERPRVLVLSERGAATSFIESLYPSRRAGLAEAEGLDLLSYELVVVDGVPIKRIRGRLLSSLLEMAERRTGSILFAADSPDFGTKGDNPPLEALLPAVLLPRSVKDLPDLAVLILIDVSGSMFGDKLSLAKVAGLELLRDLKPDDRVGMMLFSDARSWAYDFSPNRGITAAPVLEPITAGGGTDLAPALAEGLDRLSRQPIKDKHAIVITDGVTKPADFQALADRAKSLGVSISTMGVGEDVNRPLLERIAARTGGRYYRVSSLDEIPGLIFEDRKSVARPAFAQGRIPVLALNGERVAELRGMALYAPTPTASVVFSNDLGDPVLSSKELANRAVVLFASDLYGTYTEDFFSRPAAAGALKDRLDALFAQRPAQIAVAETAEGLTVLARSDRLAEPRLVLSRPGFPTVEAAFARPAPGSWAAEIAPPATGEWSASIYDRGASLASFSIAVNGGLAGRRSDAAAALAARRPAPFGAAPVPAGWLVLFLAASLGSTALLRIKR